NADVQLLLAKSYLELQQHDAAIKSAERAVAIDAQNSIYHEWLGRAYGEKADHASWFSAISLAKKTRKEFETAVQLDAKNLPARLLAVADAGKRVAPSDLREKFYRGVALVLKKEGSEEAERLLKEYAKRAPTRSGYPRPAAAHAWLGQLFEDQNKMEEAAQEFESALKLDPKNKMAQEALKR